MPFETIDTITEPMKRVQASISYRRNKSSKSGKDTKPKLIIGIPSSITDGWKPKPGVRYELCVGKGDDEGKARLIPGHASAKKGVEPRPLKAGAICFRFGYVPFLGTSAADQELIDCQRMGDVFELTLPDWFKAD